LTIKIDRCDGSNERMIALKRQIKRRAATKQSYELRKAQNEKILAEAPRDLSEEANERSRKKVIPPFSDQNVDDDH
jgi:hypothetical protein